MSGEINSYRLCLCTCFSVCCSIVILFFFKNFHVFQIKKNTWSNIPVLVLYLEFLRNVFFNYTVRVSKWSFFSLGNFSQSAENRKLTIFYKIHSKLCPGADSRFKVRGGGAFKKIAPSGGRREKFWGISCEKSRFYAKFENIWVISCEKSRFYAKNENFGGI